MPVAAFVLITLGVAALMLAGYMAVPVATHLPQSWKAAAVVVCVAIVGTLLVYQGVRRSRWPR